MPACPVVPVSWGELLDKLTILDIKRTRIGTAAARANVAREHALLVPLAQPALAVDGIPALVDALHAVNIVLWGVEEAIRAEDARAAFGETFVRLARAVYRHNDERGAIKRAINLRLASELIEEKNYAPCAEPALPFAATA